MRWKSWMGWMVLLAPALLVRMLAFFPAAVERYYSNGCYPLIARFLRWFFGWIPFSVGDILYAILFIWLLIRVISFGRKLFTRRITRPYALRVGKRILAGMLLIYVLFNLVWGLNYNRMGIGEQLKLENRSYEDRDLQTLLALIVADLNEVDSLARINRDRLQEKPILFSAALGAYKEASATASFLAYRNPSVKPSLYSILGDYLGFTGYYNPFSGEAQVNTTVPVFTRPFTTCHEIGHQLGYAKESEANFAGYLAAMASPDPAFRYSANFELYIYAASELYLRDSTLVRPLREKLAPGVRQDFAALKAFFKEYENPVEPYIRRLYGRYLRANGQPQGLRTYDEVTGWTIAYYRKKGLIK